MNGLTLICLWIYNKIHFETMLKMIEHWFTHKSNTFKLQKWCEKQSLTDYHMYLECVTKTKMIEMLNYYVLDQCSRCDQWLHFNFRSRIWPYHWTIMNRDVTDHANSQLRFVEISEWRISLAIEISHLICWRTGNRNLLS